MSTDFGKLGHVVELLDPGLIFAANGARFERALQFLKTDVRPRCEIYWCVSAEGYCCAHFRRLNGEGAQRRRRSAHAKVGPDTIAKVLFTSGSTGMPKGVINTQRMICSNQAMITQCFAFLEDEPPVLVDWLPWNHTFGGNHNFGIALFNGGSLYIDDGKPVPNGIGADCPKSARDRSDSLFQCAGRLRGPVAASALGPSITGDASSADSR